MHCRRCLRSLAQLPLQLRHQPGLHDHGYIGQLLSATAFNTERRYDKLIVNGATYDGTTGPSNVVLGSAPFTWSSDGTVTRAGWKVCARSPN